MHDKPLIPRLTPPSVLAEREVAKHGSHWRSYYYADEFIPGYRDCHYCELYGKEVPAVRRISVNVWGVVRERDVCERCAAKDGKRVEE